LPVELAVEDLFPRAEVEAAFGNGGYYFAAHEAAFQVGVGVDFAGVVVIERDGFVGSEFFKPDVEVVVKAGFIVVDKNTGGDVHGVDEAEAFLYARFTKQGFYFPCDVDKLTGLFGVEPQFFCKRFHLNSLLHSR